MENGMSADEISKLTYSSFSCERDENTPGVRFCIMFEPRNLKNEEGKKNFMPSEDHSSEITWVWGKGKVPVLTLLLVLSFLISCKVCRFYGNNDLSVAF